MRIAELKPRVSHSGSSSAFLFSVENLRFPGSPILYALVLWLLLPAAGYAWFGFAFDEPIRRLADNSVIDFVYDGRYVWLATGNGVSGTSDRGRTWRSYDETNGLPAGPVSAIATDGSRLWVATSVGSNAGGGLAFTDDYGDSWTTVRDIRFSSSFRLAYDLSVYDSVIFAPCYGGGLVRSLDGGFIWDNIFLDDSVRADFEPDSLVSRNDPVGFRGRYFSTVIDPFHNDTVIVWAGSAEGVQRFYYIRRSNKLASNRIKDIAYAGNAHWWYATDWGVSRYNDTTYSFNTFDQSKGLAGNFCVAIAANGDTVVTAIENPAQGGDAVLSVTTDNGSSWMSKDFFPTMFPDSRVKDLQLRHDLLWAAVTFSGVWVSDDLGSSWQRFWPPQFPDTVFNPLFLNVYDLDIVENENFKRISIGTDTGVVAVYFADYVGGAEDSTVFIPLFDNATWGQKVVSLASMVTEFGDEYWLAVQPLRSSNSQPAVLRSTNHGFTWDQHLTGPPAVTPHDIEIGPLFGDTVVWVATEAGMRFTLDFGVFWDNPIIYDNARGQEINRFAQMTAVELSETATHFGSSEEGAANFSLIEIDSITSITVWQVFKAQNDLDQFDFVGRSYVGQPLPEGITPIGGNFIVAMALQRSGDSTIIWVANRSTGVPSNQVNGISITSDRGQNWTQVLNNVQVWNFDFNGDTVFAAATEGLYMSTDFGENWEKLRISDPVTGRSISDSVGVFGVKWIGGDLWVGTDDGIAFSDDLLSWTIVRAFFDIPLDAPEEEQSYVTPNPYSPYLSGEMKFHYRLKNGGKVSIRIYDFANNLVAVVADGVDRVAGEQYDDFDIWNGRNGRGDIVAGGVYIYVIESTGGDELWGKIMVIP